MNSKMNLEEIYQAIADISNSMYNLKKEEKISKGDYKSVKEVLKELEYEVKMIILYGGK
jgi:hypothetical protein